MERCLLLSPGCLWQELSQTVLTWWQCCEEVFLFTSRKVWALSDYDCLINYPQCDAISLSDDVLVSGVYFLHLEVLCKNIFSCAFFIEINCENSFGP